MSHSEFGPVGDDETLIRVIISPIHINPKTSLPSPAAFASRDLMERGLSVLRRDYLNDRELKRQGQLLCKDRPERSMQGCMVGSARAVRALRDREDRKAFCVVDDEQPDQPMHATVMRSADQNELAIKELRGELMEIFGYQVAED
ncbi:hypothetical protein [Aurantimonas sp. 22II-16-19i]|uniref:hypothetical protein n=1 Tax=Aurantimonas sp. 22II-16-19i TaxID=1317114 RepID=UPI00111C0D81|nr:hypothetical protein [Aurantimonas sp. 22II-16-19i]